MPCRIHSNSVPPKFGQLSEYFAKLGETARRIHGSRIEMKILAVDDDPDFMGVFRTVLEGLGYTDLTTASSGPGGA
jgi:hypothetical protein